MKSHTVTLLTLLAFVFLTTIPAGLFMLVRPGGNLIHLPLNVLSYSIFKRFFMLSFFLSLVLGSISLVTFMRVLQHRLNASLWCYLTCIVLTGWIMIQIILAGQVNWLHLVYVFACIFTLLLASQLERYNKYFRR